VALIFNNTRRGRNLLNLAFSDDDGDTWDSRTCSRTNPANSPIRQ